MANVLSWLPLVTQILSFLILLVGAILVIVAYFKGKNRVALLGGIGLLILFLFSCCSLGWVVTDRTLVRDMGLKALQTYYNARAIILFLGGLLNLVGLGLIVAALWTGGRKD